jgi:predicted RNA-binding Zn-ribbon protein involved in translation (DUF1610 family)
MSRRTSSCPSCGAGIEFAYSNAVQSSCPFCRAVLVRRDVDIEKVGEAADLPPDASPLQLMAEGQFGGKRFRLIGRIRYEWEQGGWNEWHILFTDNSTGWLSDAQAEYAVSFLTQSPVAFPAAEELPRGRVFQLADAQYMVTTLTRARYVGFEGELPFQTTDRSEILFADLRTQDGRFGTIDYSESSPLLFLGQMVDFDSLQLSGLKEYEGW